MKLDRNMNPDGRGKYALINLRRTDKSLEEIRELVNVALESPCIQFGDNDETDFFVIKLKDKYAEQALLAYADAASEDGATEYATEIYNLARRAEVSPCKKQPD